MLAMSTGFVSQCETNVIARYDEIGLLKEAALKAQGAATRFESTKNLIKVDNSPIAAERGGHIESLTILARPKYAQLSIANDGEKNKSQTRKNHGDYNASTALKPSHPSLNSRSFSTLKQHTIPRGNLQDKIQQADSSRLIGSTIEKIWGGIASHEPQLRRPYKRHQCNVVKNVNNLGFIQHVDFSEDECLCLLRILEKLSGTSLSAESETAQAKLKARLEVLSSEEIQNTIHYARLDLNALLPNRKPKHIVAFLSDLRRGKISKPKFARIEYENADTNHRSNRLNASLLRHRELGYQLPPGRFRKIQNELQMNAQEKLLPWRSWKGASGDVVACRWSCNSKTYAVGATAPTNEEDLQYNRPRNLLLGDLITNKLYELPDHRVNRPKKPDTAHQDPDSLCDPLVYMTVSSVQFSSDGSQLYTASHDKTVKVWDLNENGAQCVETLSHGSIVTDLSVSSYFRSIFATASNSIDDSIRIYYSQPGDSKHYCKTLSSFRAIEKRNFHLFPECVRWGRTPSTKHLLLAGYQQWSDPGDLSREGHICLWDVSTLQNLKVTPGSQAIYTAAWHSMYDSFAIGGAFSSRCSLAHSSTKSIVRVWDVRSLNRYSVEYECPALDMQDITFNPLLPNIVTAGCTDSATYVWDRRKPDEVLLKLAHGRPLADWDHTREQEEADTGVMMTLWNASRLYTGSSDGIVKSWDVLRAPEDAFIQDVANLNAGVQSGDFSPDFDHLLVGDADGGVHILTCAAVDDWSKGQSISFVNAHEPESSDGKNPGTEGIDTSEQLLRSGQLVVDKNYGVVKGPNYSGPYSCPQSTDIDPERIKLIKSRRDYLAGRAKDSRDRRPPPSRPSKRRHTNISSTHKKPKLVEVIDLSSPTPPPLYIPTPEPSLSPRPTTTTPPTPSVEKTIILLSDSDDDPPAPNRNPHSDLGAEVDSEDEDQDQDDYWWSGVDGDVTAPRRGCMKG